MTVQQHITPQMMALALIKHYGSVRKAAAKVSGVSETSIQRISTGERVQVRLLTERELAKAYRRMQR